MQSTKGCVGYLDPISLKVVYPYSGQNLCMVTVDPETGKNMMIWEKKYKQEISSYNLYKIFGNNAMPIGNVLFDENPSIY